MDQLFIELKMIPGITGSFIYIDKSGVGYHDLPEKYRDKALNKIGRSIDRIFTLNETSNLDVNSVEARFNEAIVFIRQVDHGSCLVTLCEPDTNMSLVKITVDMLLLDLKSAVASARVSPAPLKKAEKPPIEKTVEEKAPELEEPDQLILQEDAATEAIETTVAETAIEEAEEDNRLPGILDYFKDTLTRTIGPIGKLIMAEVQEKWKEEGGASQARLEDLTKMLCEEINNKKLEAGFREKVSEYLK